jgi:hypothetical protein
MTDLPARVMRKLVKTEPKARLSVSLPASLVAFVKQEAKLHGTSQSAVVERAIRTYRAEHIRIEIVESLRQDYGT